MPVSSILTGFGAQFILKNELFYKCGKCWFDFRMMRPQLMKTDKNYEQDKIEHAYTENPVNTMYLEYIHFSKPKL